MLTRLWTLLFGSPLPTQELAHERLNKIRALAAFSPDALSSIAYANQEIFLALVLAGTAGLQKAFPIGVAIVFVLGVVGLSYYQVIHGYPAGGGSYVVARENLGTVPALLAGAALLVDYVLTAAVSLTAGVEAIASAFPALWPYRVELALGLLLVITVINLRGTSESGTVMALPVYFFLITYLGLLGVGIWRALVQGPAAGLPSPPPASPLVLEPLAILLILRAFASGSTALTGIEAISDNVPAFRPPEAKNAGKTLVVMAVIMAILFLGSLGLTQYLGVIPNSQETILSALARRVVGSGLYYYLVQASTLLILSVAANTSFNGFPRVASFLAIDGFLPRPLTNLGDRLVYANGITLLALIAGGLVVLFKGSSHALVPLFAVGAFLAFTISQTGMIVHWKKLRSPWWRIKSLINAIGALTTGLMVVLVGVSKFIHGAWFTLLLIPALVWMFLRIHSHYLEVGRELSLHGVPPSLRAVPPMRLVVPVSGLNRSMIEAIRFALSVSPHVSALYIELEPGSGPRVQADWQRWFPDIPLYIEPSPYRTVVGPLLNFLDRTDREHNDGQLAAVVLPEVVPARLWQNLLHNQNAWLIRTALLFRRRQLGHQRVIIDVPFHLKR
jgi:amino acid transporter